MSTQEVANKWVEYCSTGQTEKAYLELYGSNCVSVEPENVQGFPQRIEGMVAIGEKGKQWGEMVEAFHGTVIEGPIVAGDYFTAVMKMDVTMKGRPRAVNEEVAVYRVKDGKIVHEQYFYTVPNAS